MSSVIIVLIVFSFVTLIVKMGLDHDRETKGKGDLQGAAEKSLTTSELQNLIRDSVREANLDVIDRIERVENRLDQVEHNRLRSEEHTYELLSRSQLVCCRILYT